MHTLIYWFGFGGAWLLFTGPIHQASVELRAEREASARFQEVMHDAPKPEPVSNWWWLLPPVRILVGAGRRDDARKAFLASLPEEDLELITRYINIARGWALVGLGALLIALKETYELVEHYEWPLLGLLGAGRRDGCWSAGRRRGQRRPREGSRPPR